ncbi:MAG: GTPase Era [Magnetococcales bacterium]|nr:GTPase Era [Magnetococcales bacterium]
MTAAVAPEGFRSGFIAIAGRPNMGKSTFLNQVLGRKVAIVTPKPQTTRTRILGVRHAPGVQMVFLDTPGLHQPGARPLNRAMVATAFGACAEADMILYFVEAPHGPVEEDWTFLRRLAGGGAPLFLIVNKVDRTPRPILLPLLAACDRRATAEGIALRGFIPLSALTGENLTPLLQDLAALLPPGPAYFPEGQWTDQPERFIAAEILREKLFLFLQAELPYATAVQIEGFQEEEQLLRIAAQILVERDSQKGIVIGRGGSRLKQIGTAARLELEQLLGIRVYLDLRVTVRKGWSADGRLLDRLGYGNGQGDAHS